MPCDTVQTVSVNLSVSNLDLLVAGLNDIGLRAYKSGQMVYFGTGESFNQKTGELKVRSEQTVNKIKQSYSNQVVLSQAKKFGWQVKKVDQYQYLVSKR